MSYWRLPLSRSTSISDIELSGRNVTYELQPGFRFLSFSLLCTMVTYYVNRNAQSNGDHEVHTSSCSRLPDPTNRVSLGTHYGCRSAVREAKRHYTQVNGCYYCSRLYHTS